MIAPGWRLAICSKRPSFTSPSLGKHNTETNKKPQNVAPSTETLTEAELELVSGGADGNLASGVVGAGLGTKSFPA